MRKGASRQLGYTLGLKMIERQAEGDRETRAPFMTDAPSHLPLSWPTIANKRMGEDFLQNHLITSLFLSIL
jgi:hypothetical protein